MHRPDDHRAGTADDHVAMAANAAERGHGHAVDENVGYQIAGQGAIAGGWVPLACHRQTVEEDIGRAGDDGAGAMARYRAGSWVRDPGGRLSLHERHPCPSVSASLQGNRTPKTTEGWRVCALAHGKPLGCATCCAARSCCSAWRPRASAAANRSAPEPFIYYQMRNPSLPWVHTEGGGALPKIGPCPASVLARALTRRRKRGPS